MVGGYELNYICVAGRGAQQVILEAGNGNEPHPCGRLSNALLSKVHPHLRL